MNQPVFGRDGDLSRLAESEIAFSRHIPALSAVQHMTAPLGTSVAEMAEMVGGARHAYLQDGPDTWIDLPRDQWRHIRPKRAGVIRLYDRPHGGGNGGNILRLVGVIALTALAPGFGAYAATGLLGFGAAVAGTAAFTAASSLFSAGLLIGGSFLLNKLFPGEQQNNSGFEADRMQSAIANADADANLLARNAYLPKFLGQSRASLPDIVNPFNYLDNGVQTVEKLLAAEGPLLIEDIRIDGTLAADLDAVTIETRDGGEGTSTYTFVDRYTAPTAVSAELNTFSLSDADLEDQETPANSSPVPLNFRVKATEGMSEISFRVALSAMLKTTSTSTNVLLPLRIRIRQEGGTWINFPEIHISGVNQGTRQFDVRIRRDSTYGGRDIDSAFTYAFWRQVPEVTAWSLADGSTGDQWTANSVFDLGTGYQDVHRIYGCRQGIRVTLTEALFPEADYEIEVSRGIVIDASSLDSDYEISGNVVSLFKARYNSGTWDVPVSQNNYQTRVAVQQAVSIAEVQPCQRPGTALIALKSRGQSVRNVSATCTGKVMDWGGSAFDTLTASSNPALVTRQVLADLVEYSQVAGSSRFSRIAALAQSVLVNTDWTGWKAQCVSMGASCSYVATGQSVAEVLSRLLASGLARPAFGPQLRIDYFRDRSSEQPAVLFSPRNSTIRIKYESPIRPMGIRATYKNADKDWAEDEIEVRNPISGARGNWDGQSIEAIADPAWLEARLYFDLLRQYYWRTQYHVQSDFEGFACKPGTLVGIVSDLFDDTAHGARIRSVIDDATVIIDQTIPAEEVQAGITDDVDIDDLFEAGEQSFAQILTASGSELKTIVDAVDVDGFTKITFDSDCAETPTVGSHLTIGSLQNRIRRCIVVEDQPGDEFSSTLICADEAPEIFDTMSARYGWT